MPTFLCAQKLSGEGVRTSYVSLVLAVLGMLGMLEMLGMLGMLGAVVLGLPS